MSQPAVDIIGRHQRDVLLSVKNLRTWFELRRLGFIRVGHVKAVDGVSFDLEAGEALAVVGESGCGKSTLARTILGLNPITEGRIHFDGMEAVGGYKPMKAYRAGMGFVQQDPYGAMPPFLTVKRVLEEPMLIHGIRDRGEIERRITESLTELKMTPVDDYLNKYPHMLSGGQQQRVVIARAKILEPRLIVADEPVSMLDASVRVEILQLLRTLQLSHNLAVLYITHDLSTVRYFAERIFVMYAGKIVEKAQVNQLLHNGSHPYTQALLAAISDPDASNAEEYREIPPGEPPSLLNPPDGCRFHPRCRHRMDGLCDQEIPPEFTIAQGHVAACWLYRGRDPVERGD